MFLAGIDLDAILGNPFDSSNGFKYLPTELITSWIIMLIIALLALIVGIKARRADPLKKPKGILNLGEMLVEFVDNQVSELMGNRFNNFGSYIMTLGMYIILGFILGIGPIPNPFTSWSITLALALMTFFWIHFTAVRFKRFKYFKRYIEPIPFFLPINLVTMWSPVISLSFRLFGNALAGYVLIELVYKALSIYNPAGDMIFSLGFVAAPLLNAYFDVFAGCIQMVIFTILTMILVSQEAPDEDEILVEQVQAR